MRFFRRAETANDLPRFATLLAIHFPSRTNTARPLNCSITSGLPSPHVLVGNMADSRGMQRLS